MRGLCERAEGAFYSIGFIYKQYTSILQQIVVNRPRLLLAHRFIGHYRFGCEQAQQADLRKTRETYPVIVFQRREPMEHLAVMLVTCIHEGQPHVHIREKG